MACDAVLAVSQTSSVLGSAASQSWARHRPRASEFFVEFVDLVDIGREIAPIAEPLNEILPLRLPQHMSIIASLDSTALRYWSAHFGNHHETLRVATLPYLLL